MKLSKAMGLYLIGLIIFLLGLLVPAHLTITKNLLFTTTVLGAGYHVLGEGLGDTINQSQRQHQFVPNIHLLMALAAVGAMIIGSFEEAALLILIFAGAHFLEEYAENKSRSEITALLKMAPVQAQRLSADGYWQTVLVKDLQIGDTLRVLNGAQVPTDGRITKGQALINEAAISGESLPQEKQVGAEVFGGTINGNSTFEMQVTKDSEATVFAQIIHLVQAAQDSPSPTATTIQKLAPIYVKIVLGLLPVMLVVGTLIAHWSWDVSFYRMVGFLVAASPCALAASAVPATLAGISNLARQGVLFKGGSYLANLAHLQTIAFDKTGTLTRGKPQVTDQYFEFPKNQEKLISVIVTMENQSNHPLAQAVKEHFKQVVEITDLTCHNQVGQGLSAEYAGHFYQIGKPTSFKQAPSTFAKRCQRWSSQGKTVVYIACDYHVIGILAFMDLPKPSAQQAINYFNQQQIQTIMITGDSAATGQAVAQNLRIKQAITNVLPTQKAHVIAQLQQKQPVAMVGDGINDAPALANANIGVAMGSGTDVAIDVADVVLVKNDLSKLSFAHRLSTKMNQVVFENIILSLIVVLVLVVLNALQLTNIAWGVVLHEGSTLLVIFNGLRLLFMQR